MIASYLPCCVAASCHTKEPIKKVYADKGYYGKPNSGFLYMNDIADGIMRKDTTSTKLTDYEKERNKQISKKRYIVEQYFGLSHLYSNAFRARFTSIAINAIDTLFRQTAFNLFRVAKILAGQCKYRNEVCPCWSTTQINHATAPITDLFEANIVAIIEKLIDTTS